MKAMKPVDEEQYEITIDVHGMKDGPRLGRLRVLNEVSFLIKYFLDTLHSSPFVCGKKSLHVLTFILDAKVRRRTCFVCLETVANLYFN